MGPWWWLKLRPESPQCSATVIAAHLPHKQKPVFGRTERTPGGLQAQGLLSIMPLGTAWGLSIAGRPSWRPWVEVTTDFRCGGCPAAEGRDWAPPTVLSLRRTNVSLDTKPSLLSSSTPPWPIHHAIGPFCTQTEAAVWCKCHAGDEHDPMRKKISFFLFLHRGVCPVIHQTGLVRSARPLRTRAPNPPSRGHFLSFGATS